MDLLEDYCNAWGQHVLGLGGARSRVGAGRAAPLPTNATQAVRRKRRVLVQLTLVDVGGVCLLAGLGALLLVARGGGLLAGILLLRSLGGSGGGLGGGLLVGGLGRHFGDVD